MTLIEVLRSSCDQDRHAAAGEIDRLTAELAAAKSLVDDLAELLNFRDGGAHDGYCTEVESPDIFGCKCGHIGSRRALAKLAAQKESEL